MRADGGNHPSVLSEKGCSGKFCKQEAQTWEIIEDTCNGDALFRKAADLQLFCRALVNCYFCIDNKVPKNKLILRKIP